MLISLKMFVQWVESIITADKEYEKDPTPFNKNVMDDLRNKVDGWISWVHSQEDAGLTKNVPPFIGKTRPQTAKGGIPQDIYDRLVASHTPEEVEKFNKLMKGEF